MEKLNACRVDVMVSDMDQAIDFYVGKLGLELKNRYGNHYAEVLAANLVLGIHPRTEKTISGTNMAIGFGVSGFDENVERLQAKGIAVLVANEGYIRLAHFSDPDQNALYLAENK